MFFVIIFVMFFNVLNCTPGRRTVGAARTRRLAAPNAGGAAVDCRGPVVDHGEGDARRPGAAQ